MRKLVAAAVVVSVAAAPSALADPYGRVLAPLVDSGTVKMSNGVLTLCANGHAMTSGWSSVVVVIPQNKQNSANGTYSVSVEGYAPKGMTTPTITPFATQPVGWPAGWASYPSDLKAVRFLSANNSITIPLGSGVIPCGGNVGKTP